MIVSILSERIYNGQNECHKAISESKYAYVKASQRRHFLKSNVDKITKVNGLPVCKVSFIGENDLEFVYDGGSHYQWHAINYLDVELSIDNGISDYFYSEENSLSNI